MRAKAIVFDLDGTLADTLMDLAEALNYALERFGLAGQSVEACRQMVGDGTRTFVSRAIPADRQEMVEEVLGVAREYYRENYLQHTRLYEGVYDAVTGLRRRGVKLSVLTNKDEQMARRIVEHFFAPGVFEFVMGSPDGSAIKPGREAIEKLLNIMGASAREVTVVGDSPVDMATAQAVGARGVGVAWGFRSRAELIESGAFAVIDAPAELLELEG